MSKRAGTEGRGHIDLFLEDGSTVWVVSARTQGRTEARSDSKEAGSWGPNVEWGAGKNEMTIEEGVANYCFLHATPK